MFMSGHRSESSLKSYNRTPSTKQKMALSHTLHQVAEPSDHEISENQAVMSVKSPLDLGQNTNLPIRGIVVPTGS